VFCLGSEIAKYVERERERDPCSLWADCHIKRRLCSLLASVGRCKEALCHKDSRLQSSESLFEPPSSARNAQNWLKHFLKLVLIGSNWNDYNCRYSSGWIDELSLQWLGPLVFFFFHMDPDDWKVTFAIDTLELRMFHSFCDRGEPENALDIFDREQLLALGTESAEASEEIWAEYPRIVADNYPLISRLFFLISLSFAHSICIMYRYQYEYTIYIYIWL